MHVTIDGNDCTLKPCVDANGDCIVYDGVNFTVTDVSEEAIEFGDDMFRQYYYDNPYMVETGEPITVTPPVSVPIWVGVY